MKKENKLIDPWNNLIKYTYSWEKEGMIEIDYDIFPSYIIHVKDKDKKMYKTIRIL